MTALHFLSFLTLLGRSPKIESNAVQYMELEAEYHGFFCSFLQFKCIIKRIDFTEHLRYGYWLPVIVIVFSCK